MITRRTRLIAKAVPAIAIAVGGLVVVGASPAGAAPTWSTPTVLPGITGQSLSFISVSCTSVGECTAVGSSDIAATPNAVITETSGVWGTPTALAGPSGVQFPGFNSVSCSSPGNCTAVGQGWTVATETAGLWSPVTKLPVGSGNFYSVSCTSAGNCTAVGSGFKPVAVVETNGIWGTPTYVVVRTSSGPLDATGGFNSISCTSVGNCTASGDLVPASVYADPEPIVVDETGGVWGAPTVLSSVNGSAGSISCASVGNCTLVGNNSLKGLVATETGGVWSSLTELPASDYYEFTSVSCATAGNCTAVGTGGSYPYVDTETAGVWDAPAAALTSYGVFNSVSCTAVNSCTAVGSGNGGAMVSVFPGPFAITPVVPPAASPGSVYSPLALTYANASPSAGSFTTTFKWKATGLPKGMKLNATTGVLSGKLSAHDATGVFPITITVTETVTTLNGSKKVKTPTTATFTVPLTVA